MWGADPGSSQGEEEGEWVGGKSSRTNVIERLKRQKLLHSDRLQQRRMPPALTVTLETPPEPAQTTPSQPAPPPPEAALIWPDFGDSALNYFQQRWTFFQTNLDKNELKEQ